MTWPLVLPVTLWALFPAPILAPGVGRPKAQILGEALASVLLLGQGTPLWLLFPTCHMTGVGFGTG